MSLKTNNPFKELVCNFVLFDYVVDILCYSEIKIYTNRQSNQPDLSFLHYKDKYYTSFQRYYKNNQPKNPNQNFNDIYIPVSSSHLNFPKGLLQCLRIIYYIRRGGGKNEKNC